MNSSTVHDDGGLGGTVLVAPLMFGVVVAVLMVGSVAGWNPLWPENAATLSESVALRDMPNTLALISQGHDPNATYDVRDELLTSRRVQVTPLQAAVSTREPDVVDILLANGARLDETTGPVLICLARKVNAPDVETQLAARVAAPADCTNIALPW
jgi:hypothetical protein